MKQVGKTFGNERFSQALNPKDFRPKRFLRMVERNLRLGLSEHFELSQSESRVHI